MVLRSVLRYSVPVPEHVKASVQVTTPSVVAVDSHTATDSHAIREISIVVSKVRSIVLNK